MGDAGSEASRPGVIAEYEGVIAGVREQFEAGRMSLGERSAGAREFSDTTLRETARLEQAIEGWKRGLETIEKLADE